MQAGTILGKRYRIVKPVGGGGMAVVYQAEDMFLDRRVAVKVLRSQFAADEEFVRRFRREAQAAASLGHPNIVSIYDVGEEDGNYYIVMELIEGSTLKSKIAAQGPLPVAEAARVALAILSGLAHAHKHKVIHRDIKPHNILLATDGQVKVADFGIARAATTDTLTHTGAIVGSAHYFSPEMARGQATGERSDIYSLGVVLYEMLTGQVPFQAETPITVALKHLEENVLPPAVLNPEIPQELQAIVLHAMQKHPEDRYQSAAEMAADLEQFLLLDQAGRTQRATGDYPTQDLRALRRLTNSNGRPRPGAPPAAGPDSASPRPVRWGLWISLVMIVLAGGAVAGGFMLAARLFNVPDVPVPEVRGLPLSVAQERLEAAGLSFTVMGEEFSEQPANTVTWQEEEPPMTVKQGRKVGLRISMGPRQIRMPGLVGLSRAEAEDQLAREGLRPVVHQQFSKEVAEGRVIRHLPGAGEGTAAGAVVDLWVSSGPLTVPSLVGRPLEEARQTLSDLGLTVGEVSRIDFDLPVDTVVRQTPPASGDAAPGDTVNLIVSSGVAPPVIHESTEYINVNIGFGTVTVRVVLVDGDGTMTTIHELQHGAGDQFPLVVRYKGPGAKLEVYFDQILAEVIMLP